MNNPNRARVPVFAHLEGICHIYIHKDADPEKARKITLNAKMRRTGICGAAETLLIDKSVAGDLLGEIVADLTKAGCAVRGDVTALSLVPNITAANEEDWHTEYLDSILSVRVVDGLEMAIAHIGKYGSSHTNQSSPNHNAPQTDFLLKLIALSSCITHPPNLPMAVNLAWGQKLALPLAAACPWASWSRS